MQWFVCCSGRGVMVVSWCVAVVVCCGHCKWWCSGCGVRWCGTVVVVRWLWFVVVVVQCFVVGCIAVVMVCVGIHNIMTWPTYYNSQRKQTQMHSLCHSQIATQPCNDASYPIGYNLAMRVHRCLRDSACFHKYLPDDVLQEAGLHGTQNTHKCNDSVNIIHAIQS